ncbi:MAG TPA: ABC transporter [Clostridiales bacterium]|nr:ABC transporter [Clostridiales bacterium]
MRELSPLPKTVRDMLSEKGIPEQDILTCVCADMDETGTLCDAYAVMTKDELAILTLLPTLRPGKRTFPYIKPCIQTGYAELDFTHFMLSDICDFRLEEYVGSGKLTARLGRDETPTDAPEGPDMPPRWNRRSGPGGLFGSGGKESVSTVPLSSIGKEPNKGIDRICLFNFTFRKKAVVQQFLEILKVVAKTGELPAESGTKKETVCPKCKTPYPDPHSPVCPRCMDKMQMVKRLLPFFYKYKFFIILIFLCILASSVLELLSPYISSKIFYDEVLAVNGKYYGQIVGIILVIVGANLLSTVVSMITQLINSRISARVTYDLKKIIFSSFGRLSLSFFTGRQTGGLMTQLNSDANTLYWFFCDAFPYMIINIIQIIGVSAVLLYMDWKLTLLTVLPLPLLLYVYRLILYAFKKMHARQFSKSRSFYDLIADVLSGIRIVKSFSKEKEEVSRFDAKSRDEANTGLKLTKMSNTIFPLFHFMMFSGAYIVWIYGGWKVSQGVMQYGTMMLFISYLSSLFGPMNQLADMSGTLTNCINAIHRLFEVHDAIPDVVESKHPVSLGNVQGKVEFDHVGFSYTKDKKTIDGVTFTVETGETLGIVGKTGAGKSTLANLLTRLYDVSEGGIYVDGVDIRNLSFDELHRSIAIVSQETYLFRGTIMDNIRYAKPDAGEEEVMAAAKVAYAHPFIIQYPDGYNTMIGKGYKELSGGERQRVSIARAILKNPKILILDEATASMDTETERQIQKAITEITRGRTTFIIAHRLSTLRDADKLIVIDGGKMVESGTHRELIIKPDGVYAKLYKLQLEALKTIGIDP